MIVQDNYYIGNTPLVYTYSDQGYKILQVETGDEYDEAHDLIGSDYTYAEIIGEYTTKYCAMHKEDFPEMQFTVNPTEENSDYIDVPGATYY